MNSCQHYKSGCLRNKQQKPRRFFNIYGLQSTVLDLSPNGIYRATFRLPHHGNLKLCSWHIHSSNGLARWFLAIVTSGGSLESPSHYIIYIGKKLCKNLLHQKKIASATVPSPNRLKTNLCDGMFHLQSRIQLQEAKGVVIRTWVRPKSATDKRKLQQNWQHQ